MAHKNYCQGTKCHTYDTQSRIRGTKDNKTVIAQFKKARQSAVALN